MMAYKIEYGMGHKVKVKVGKRKRFVLPAAVLVAVAMVCGIPQLRTMLWNGLLPGNEEITAAALWDLATDLQAGQGLSEAVTAFCRQILSESGQ